MSKVTQPAGRRAARDGALAQEPLPTPPLQLRGSSPSLGLPRDVPSSFPAAPRRQEPRPLPCVPWAWRRDTCGPSSNVALGAGGSETQTLRLAVSAPRLGTRPGSWPPLTLEPKPLPLGSSSHCGPGQDLPSSRPSGGPPTAGRCGQRPPGSAAPRERVEPAGEAAHTPGSWQLEKLPSTIPGGPFLHLPGE